MDAHRRHLNSKPLLALLLFFLLTRFAILGVAHLAYARNPDTGWLPSSGERGDLHRGDAPPGLVAPLARWDALYYSDIARNGYPEPTGAPVFHAAFFPLYPLLVRAVTPITGNTFWAAVLVANASTLLTVLLLYRLVTSRFGREVGLAAACAFVASPGSHFLSFPYTEGLFALLLVAALWLLERDRLLAAGLVGAFATATRSTGVAVTAALLILAWHSLKDARTFFRATSAALATLVGIGAYAVYCHVRFGDWLYFNDLQQYWGRHPSIIGPARAFLAFRFDPDYYLVGLGAVVLLVMSWRKLPTPWFAMAAVLLMMPLATGTLKSIIRLQAVNVPLFITAALWLRGRSLVIFIGASVLLMLYETARFCAGFANN